MWGHCFAASVRASVSNVDEEGCTVSRDGRGKEDGKGLSLSNVEWETLANSFGKRRHRWHDIFKESIRTNRPWKGNRVHELNRMRTARQDWWSGAEMRSARVATEDRSKRKNS